MTPPRRDMRSSVNKPLTPKRRRRITENDDYAAFVRRVMHAYSRRIAAGDIDAITEMASIAAEFDGAIRCAIHGLRARGYSWTDIGIRLGITRQAAQQRWGSDSH
jgi:hypothetical protein